MDVNFAAETLIIFSIHDFGEAGSRRQEAGGRRQEQEAGGRKQEAGRGGQWTVDSWTVDSGQ
jgi:hypothetical protein